MAILRTLRLTTCILVCLVAVPAANAGAAARRGAARPSIATIGPASAAVGDTLTIRGRGFLPGRRRDSVSFTRAGSPTVAVKATDATRTRIRVVVPKALARYLSDTQPTRFRVRVRARRFSVASAARTRSVLVLSPAVIDAVGAGGDDCASADPAGDVTATLDDALGTDLGDVVDDTLPGDDCDPASATGDDPATADDGADPADTDPADDATDASDPSGADDPASG